MQRPEPTPDRPQNVCLDKGYDYAEVQVALGDRGFPPHIRRRGEETKEADRNETDEPSRKARRWVVERTHSWFNRFRSLLIRWAKKEKNYLGLLHFVCGLIAYRAAGSFG